MDWPWMPHGSCLAWNTTIIFWEVVSNGFIALAYLLIPAALISASKRWRRKHPETRLIVFLTLFAIFIIGCACTHIMDILVIWKPLYLVDAIVRSLTAIVSVAVAVELWRNLPAMMEDL